MLCKAVTLKSFFTLRIVVSYKVCNNIANSKVMRASSCVAKLELLVLDLELILSTEIIFFILNLEPYFEPK